MRFPLPHPLAWMVTAEVAVVAILLAFSWHLYQSHGAGHMPMPARDAIAPGDRHRPTADPRRSAASPTPTASNAPFAGTPVTVLPVDLSRLNRDQAALERAQSSLIARLSAAMRNYIERVVVPAVLRAERASTATTPATKQSSAASRKMP